MKRDEHYGLRSRRSPPHIPELKDYFYLNKDSLDNTKRDEHYGLRSRRSPPHIPELKDYLYLNKDSLDNMK